MSIDADREFRAKMALAAQAVAPLLGKGWAAAPYTNADGEVYDHLYVVSHVDGMTLHFSARYPEIRKQRIEIRPSFPDRTKRGEYIQPSGVIPVITVSGGRAASAIAKEIQRRLLPDLSALLERQRKRIAEYNAADDLQSATQQLLVRELNGSLPVNNDRGHVWLKDAFVVYSARIDGDLVTADLRVSSAEFIAAVKLIRKMRSA